MPMVCLILYCSRCPNLPIAVMQLQNYILEQPDNMAILQKGSPTDPAVLGLVTAVQAKNPNIPDVCGTTDFIMLAVTIGDRWGGLSAMLSQSTAAAV
jgi:hypothetical protein